jgi:hypothetical protein
LLLLPNPQPATPNPTNTAINAAHAAEAFPPMAVIT